jgi:hypothetical protein
MHNHKFQLFFDPRDLEKLQDNTWCHHGIELSEYKEKLGMGPIYQLSQKQEKLLVNLLDTMIKGGKFRPSSSTVRSSIILVFKPNGYGLGLCIDYRHLNDYTKTDRTPSPIMEELQSRLNGAIHITKVNHKSWFYFISIALGREMFATFRTNFGIQAYMVMPFMLYNTSTTIQREFNTILRHLLGVELFIQWTFMSMKTTERLFWHILTIVWTLVKHYSKNTI